MQEIQTPKESIASASQSPDSINLLSLVSSAPAHAATFDAATASIGMKQQVEIPLPNAPLAIPGKAANPAHSNEKPAVPQKPADPSAIPTAVVEHTAHRDGKWVALTFDDGPNPTYTPQVLAILKENHIHATFCLVGQQVKQYPALVKAIVADGHKLADHSMSHDEFLPRRSEDKIRAEILGDKNLIQSVVPGTPVEYYRAPGGNWSQHVRQLSASWGMKPLGWSVDTRDWERPGTEKILSTIQKELRPGGVILMHDAGGNRTQSVEALKQLIPILKKEGYQFDFPA